MTVHPWPVPHPLSVLGEMIMDLARIATWVSAVAALFVLLAMALGDRRLTVAEGFLRWQVHRRRARHFVHLLDAADQPATDPPGPTRGSSDVARRLVGRPSTPRCTVRDVRALRRQAVEVAATELVTAGGIGAWHPGLRLIDGHPPSVAVGRRRRVCLGLCPDAARGGTGRFVLIGQDGCVIVAQVLLRRLIVSGDELDTVELWIQLRAFGGRRARRSMRVLRRAVRRAARRWSRHDPPRPEHQQLWRALMENTG